MDVWARTASSAAQPTAGDIMSSPVFTVPPEATARQVADLLTQHRISAVPVVDGAGAVLGLVSEFDLLAKAGGTAAELMTTTVIAVSDTSPVEDVRHLLIDRRIRRVPVLRAGRLAGIVSRRDVIALMATEWVCQVCGEPVRGAERPAECPKCHAVGDRFDLQEQPPGS